MSYDDEWEDEAVGQLLREATAGAEQSPTKWPRKAATDEYRGVRLSPPWESLNERAPGVKRVCTSALPEGSLSAVRTSQQRDRRSADGSKGNAQVRVRGSEYGIEVRRDCRRHGSDGENRAEYSSADTTP